MFIPDTEFAALVNQVKGKMWVNVSGCEAAGFDVGISSPTKLFTASSLATEKSYEWPAAGASVFSYYMVRRGMLEGVADSNRDFRVSVQEAFRYAAANAPAFTAGQAQGPQHPQIAGGDGAELFLDDPLSGPGPAAAPGAPAPAAVSGGGKSANCAILNCFH